MSELLNSYTFEAKKIVYYSVTVGANNKTEAKRIASDFEHCQHYEEVEYCEGYEYKVGKLLETTDDKALKYIKPTEDQMTKLTYSDSPFFSNWSQTYFTNLTLDQHIANNNWLMNTLSMLKDDGILYVPILDKQFNRLGEEVK